MTPCNPILRELDTFDDFGPWLTAHGFAGRGAEIGVGSSAVFATSVLSQWAGSMYLVDPFRKFPEEVYFDSRNAGSQFGQDRAFEMAKMILDKFDPRGIWLRATSVSAATSVDDRSLDFAHIDANHSYEAVTDDIRAWWPKVRLGGVLCGHDLYTRHKEANSDALNAVLDFAEEIDTRPHVTWCTSWWFIKE